MLKGGNLRVGFHVLSAEMVVSHGYNAAAAAPGITLAQNKVRRVVIPGLWVSPLKMFSRSSLSIDSLVVPWARIGFTHTGPSWESGMGKWVFWHFPPLSWEAVSVTGAGGQLLLCQPV